MSILNINTNNKSLIFISERIKSDDYRGIHLFQHYRYDLSFIKVVLSAIHEYQKNNNNSLLKIRTTDSSRRPENHSDELDYSNVIDKIKRSTGKGTQDAIRKIVFVDCNRMGFLDRYDKNKKLIEIEAKSKTQFVGLSEKGKKFVETSDIKEEYFIFSSGIYRIVGTLINTLENLISKYNLGFISKYEFMYFVSAIDDKSTFSIDIEKCAELIKEFRLLGPAEKENVTRILKEEMNPKKFKGNKKSKRDFHNWENEATQIYLLLSTTVYFEVRNGIKLILNSSDTSLDSILGKEFKKNRSLQEKNNYYLNHGIKSKISGFELHHVVALEYADSPALYKLLDDWKNMVYIDGYSHAKITQNRNKNIVMDSVKDDILLKDYSLNVVYLKNVENISYDINKQQMMIEHNKKLRTTVE